MNMMSLYFCLDVVEHPRLVSFLVFKNIKLRTLIFDRGVPRVSGDCDLP